MFHYRKILFLLLSLLFSYIHAQSTVQYGPRITSPAEGASIHPGSSVEVDFTFALLGPGTYSTSVQLLNNSTSTATSTYILTNQTVTVDNSTDAATMNGSFTWNVPGNLAYGVWYLKTSQLLSVQIGSLDVDGLPYEIVISGGQALKGGNVLLISALIISIFASLLI